MYINVIAIVLLLLCFGFSLGVNSGNVSEAAGENISIIKVSAMEEADIILLCQDYLYRNCSKADISTITNMGAPIVDLIDQLPDRGRYAAVSEEPGSGPYYKVTFTTTKDGLLGPVVFLVNQEKEIFGIYYRE